MRNIYSIEKLISATCVDLNTLEKFVNMAATMTSNKMCIIPERLFLISKVN